MNDFIVSEAISPLFKGENLIKTSPRNRAKKRGREQ